MTLAADERSKTNILLFGLGAIGGFYAFILSRDPHVSLSVVARSNYDAVKRDVIFTNSGEAEVLTGRQGLLIQSENHGERRVRFDAVYKHPSDSPHTFDFIVCAHKAIDIWAAPAEFKSVTNDNTTFVLMQNGVGNEDPFRETYPGCTIISGSVWVGAIQTSPGVIKHTKSEETILGLFPSPKVPDHTEQGRLERFCEHLKAGQTQYSVSPNIQVDRWKKVVWNAAWNPITTLTMVDTQTWLAREEAMTMTRKLMHEMIDVAQQCSVPLEHSLVDEQIARILAMPGIGSSMQTDAKAGRKLELEVILGVPLKWAREKKMDVPTLAAVYALTEAVDGRLGKVSGKTS